MSTPTLNGSILWKNMNLTKKTLGKYSYIRYIKGLGSLVEEEYSRVVNDPQLETVVLNEGWKEKFDLLFVKGKEASDKRKEWIQEVYVQ